MGGVSQDEAASLQRFLLFVVLWFMGLVPLAAIAAFGGRKIIDDTKISSWYGCLVFYNTTSRSVLFLLDDSNLPELVILKWLMNKSYFFFYPLIVTCNVYRVTRYHFSCLRNHKAPAPLSWRHSHGWRLLTLSSCSNSLWKLLNEDHKLKWRK